MKKCIFGDRVQRIHVDGKTNRREKKSVFKQERMRVDGALTRLSTVKLIRKKLAVRP